MDRYVRSLAMVCLCTAGFIFPARSQRTLVVDSVQPSLRKVVAGPEYKAGPWKTFWWGANYRQEWTTPVTVPVLNLDSLYGGLTPVELGGGRQTETLHLKDAEGKYYVLRKVNKTYIGALPPIAAGTFLETIINDQVSTLHPYAALTVPPMAAAAGVFHALPRLWLVPYSPRLGRYNPVFANTLCLLEERPDETHTDSKNFGRPEDIDGSATMMENVTGNNDFGIVQQDYMKTRLFDMLIGDWGRHLDNWRWAQFASGNRELYKPVPKDRDQVYARFEGVMIKILKSVAGLKQLQSFGPTIENISRYNYPAIGIDRRFTNGLSLQAWTDTARAIQASLTDNVIESAIRQLPPEVFAISGKMLISSLKKRRDDLAGYAAAYYRFLAEYVDIPGTEKNEWFEVKRLNDQQTSVSIYKINGEKQPQGNPLFHRVFLTEETRELRLYGIGGDDVYTVTGSVKEGITVRIIGGTGEDSVYDASLVKGLTHKTKIYDRQGTHLLLSGEAKARIRDTTYVYPFKEAYHYNYAKRTIAPGLDPFYRLFIGLAYRRRIYGWREKPFKSDLQTGINFSLFEKSFHPYIRYTRPQMFGAWNIQLTAGYDGARRLNYFGLGNETRILSGYRRFHWLRTENLYATAGINTPLGQHHRLFFTLYYEGIKVLPQAGRFISKGNNLIDPSTYQWKHFAGTRFDYLYNHTNDPLVPTRGATFFTTLAYTQNLQQHGRSFTTAAAVMDFYQPLFSSFSLFIRSGGATLWGQPEFYQYNTIGGGITVRGYVRNRFFGRTIYYQQNELRFIKNVKSYFFNGKGGLIAVYDIGRVWQPGEASGKWHSGIGGGILVAPFNKFSARVYYTFSPEDQVINLRIGTFF